MKKPLYLILTTILISISFTYSCFATPLFNFDVKVDPKSISPGKIMDINVYMVENRNADEPSRWEGGRILSLSGRFRTGPSEMISFTPREEFRTEETFVSIYNNGFNAAFFLTTGDSRNFTPDSGGVITNVDNSGITGRSEVLIGVLRVKIGPEIRREDGEGNFGPVEIFQVHFGFRPPQSNLTWTLKLPSGSHTGRETLENHVVILKSDAETENEISTKNLSDTIAEAKTIIVQIKRKIRKKNRQEQLQLRKNLREAAKSIKNIATKNKANISTNDPKFNITKAAKNAFRKLKIFARKKVKDFKKSKKLAKKALTQIEKKLIIM